MPSFVCLSVCLCVCVSGTLGGMPGHARRACPKGTPGRRARRARPKGVSRRGPEGATAAAGRQGVLEGGGEKGGGSAPPKKNVSPKIFFCQKFPLRGHCGRRPPGGVGERGRRMGGQPSPSKKIYKKKFFLPKIPPKEPLWPQASRGC